LRRAWSSPSANGGVIAETQAQQVAEHCRLRIGHFRTAVGGQQRNDAAAELLDHLGWSVVVRDQQAPGQRIAQQAIRALFAVRVRATLQQLKGFRLQVGPGFEFEQQTALAQAGLTDDRDELQRRPLVERGKGPLQRGELGLAADHARLEPFDAARCHAKRTWPGAQHQVCRQRLITALHLQRWLSFDVEHPTHVTPRVVADAHAAHRRGLLHARGDVDHGPADAAFFVHTAAQQHLAGVHAHPQAEAMEAMRALDLVADGEGFFEQRKAGTYRVLGVVFKTSFDTEHGQQVVTSVLKDLPVMVLHKCGQATQRAIHQRLDVFRVQGLAKPRRAGDVAEQHADLAQAAQRARTTQRDQAGAQGRHRKLCHGVAQRLALAFQRCQCGFDLGAVVVGHWCGHWPAG